MYLIDEPDFWFHLALAVGASMKYSQPEPLTPSGRPAPIPLATRLKRIGKICLWIIGAIVALPVVLLVFLCLVATFKSLFARMGL